MSGSDEGNGGYALSREPVLESAQPADLPEQKSVADEMPVAAERPLLVLVARDPRTLFAYWDVDWKQTFQEAAPAIREVQLRVLREGGDDETTVAVEPRANGAYITVAEPAATYRAELGYIAPPNEWRCVASSGDVITPADSIAESSDYELVTVPLHLEFQRVVEMFRGSRFDSASLNSALADLQKRAEARPQALTADEQTLLREIDWPTLRVEAAATKQALHRNGYAAGAPAFHARWQRILGFGATTSSPSHADGGGGS